MMTLQERLDHHKKMARACAERQEEMKLQAAAHEGAAQILAELIKEKEKLNDDAENTLRN